MTFGHAERRKERDNQLDDAMQEANASSSSSSRFCLVPTKSIESSTDLERPEGLLPKMGACGQRNEINQSLELDDQKKKIVVGARDDAMTPRLSFFYSKLS
jgi:hypothetical protein